MKKILYLIIFTSITLLASGQTKVAVYAPEENNSGFDRDTKEFVVGEFVRAINQSGTYIAVNRSKEFNSGISSENSYQYSGMVNEKEIAQLGKRSGASLVCVVVFRKVLGDLNIEARLIDVEREDIVASDNRVIINPSASTLKNDAEAIAKTILGTSGNNQTPVRSASDVLMYDKGAKSKVAGYNNGNWGDLSVKDVKNRIINCPVAYQLYNKGYNIKKRWRIAELSILGAGVVGAFFTEGDAILLAVLPVLVTECIAVPIGKSKIKKAVNTYNNQCGTSNLTLRMGVSPSGLGLTLNF